MKPSRLVIGIVAAALGTVTGGCGDSKSPTAPAMGGAPAAENVAGSWSGSFVSYATACSGSPVTAMLQQSGSDVTGNVVAAPCGIHGYLHASISGKVLSGRLEMQGCTGGAVLGTASDSGISLTIGDFQRPVVSGDAIVIPGGATTLHR